MFQRLRDLREDKGLNQKAMAELLNVHQTTYSDYELGNNIPTDALIQLALFFDVATDYLLEMDIHREEANKNKEQVEQGNKEKNKK